MASYWYPTQTRVEELICELGDLEKAARAQTLGVSLVSLFSTALTQAEKTVGFPVWQIPKWFWVGSQFRLRGDDRADVAILARGALTFLTMRLARGLISEDDVRDLNWVLDSTIHRLGDLLGAQNLRSCLSINDLARIETRLSSYTTDAIFDPEVLRSRIKDHLKNLDALAKNPNLKSIASKIEALFKACQKSGRESAVARAALLYLADIPDVVSDSQGVLGLVDDIYVIEKAYATIEAQTRCLPLLETLLEKWPFVADLPFVGPGPAPLDRFSQYIACAFLFSLFETSGRSMLVVRESAPHCMIASLMAAVETLRKKAKAENLDVATWTKGQPITIGDGTRTFRAIYDGVAEVGGARKFRIGVRDNGWIFVDERMLPYISRAQKHTTLSKGNEVSQWIKDRYIDPLVYLTGSSRQKFKEHECILLVGARQKLDAYLSCMRPQGSSMAALIGVRYVTANHRFENLDDTVSDTPCVYACSDVNTAIDLIRDPPEHVKAWRVIVDGARSGRAFFGAASGSEDLASTPVCILAELHEREAARDIARLGISVWYLEDQDVEVPPLTAVKPNAADDSLVRALTRQANHWTVSRSVHVATNEFLEQVSDCMRERLSPKRDDISETSALDLSLSAFLRGATSTPIRNTDTDRHLATLCKNIASQASVLRQYDPQANRLYDLFKTFITIDPISFDREGELRSLAGEIQPEETVAVVCRSEKIAQICKECASREFANFKWMNLERLRQTAPFDRVIVPGWLDKLAMRELNDNGYGSRLELIFYPFEKKWFTETVEATRRWETQLNAATFHRLGDLTQQLNGRSASLPELAPSSAPAIGEQEVAADEDYIDKLEARAIEALSNKVAQERIGQATAKAQLVLFEKEAEYAYLPPAGKVIVLSREVLDEEILVKGHAERLLFRTVSALEPGMVVALPTGTDRDLIDARADQFLKDAAGVREKAALWKTALRRFLSKDGWLGPSNFSKLLAAAGQKRQPSTIFGWIHHDSTVAPSNYKEVVPVIAKLTKDTELLRSCTDVLQSIDLVYRARAKAAEAIVRELFSGKIDIDEDELRFEISGGEIRYLLRQVRRLEGIQEVPTEMIGKVGSLASDNASRAA